MNQIQRPTLFSSNSATSIGPLFLIAAAAALLLMFVLPRKYVLAPLLVLSMLVPAAQVVMLGPFHFGSFRILMIGAWIRLLWQRYISDRQPSVQFCAVDKLVILYTLTCLVCYTLLWQTTASLVDQLGKMYNILGFYFVFRFFIRDRDDVERTIKVFVVVGIVIAACMFNEQITGRNVFAIFGAPEFTANRGGYRSQGPFEVYISAGAFGATILPLYLSLWRRGSRLMAILGILAAITIAVTSRTSTAISAGAAAIMGLGMWVFRNNMRWIRWGFACSVGMLALVMKAPVWALLARVDLVGGSTGWHRYKIVDNFVHHFSDWWLLGANNWWTWEGGDDMWDLANQYVSVGESTGLLSLIFFLATVVYSFKYLGRARKTVEGDHTQEWFLWLFGVALFANLVAFLGVSYVDQIFIWWYCLLAMIVAMVSTVSLPLTSEAEVDSSEWVESAGGQDGDNPVDSVWERPLARP
jgi:hypothetical protein